MNPSELLLTANKIAQSHVSSGADINASITKIASEQNLSKPQIERLVEETNKATFLGLLEKKGEQEFPVANYETIKAQLVSKMEKNASENLKFTVLGYSDSEFKAQVGTNRITDGLEKNAGEVEVSEEGIACWEALVKIASEIWSNYNTLLDLEALGQKRYGVKYADASTLVKVACEHNDTQVGHLAILEANIIKQGAILEVISQELEKHASVFWGETNPAKAAMRAGGSPTNRAAKAAGAVVNMATKGIVKGVAAVPVGLAKGALIGGAVAAPIVLPFALKHGVKRNLNTTLTLGTEGSKAIREARATASEHNYVGPMAKEGMEKNAFIGTALKAGANMLFKSPLKTVGNGMMVAGAANTLTKPIEASIGTMPKVGAFGTGMQHALEFVTPAVSFGLSPFGMLAGIAAATAKKLGGGIALTMNKKEFEHSFDTIMKNNPELAENKQQVRGYFDVVSRHAPSLAKDPLVAESIVKNMNAFGGVDYNTVRGLRETEALGRSGPSEKGLSGLTAGFGKS